MITHYLSTALRHFGRHRTTTALNVVCLTIGLVCFLAIYAVVVYLGSGDRHYANADRIFMIGESSNDSITASLYSGPSSLCASAAARISCGSSGDVLMGENPPVWPRPRPPKTRYISARS